uniref:Uncharacterized protein n=1 Tax=Naja naja TaxID=35670 RepID=A0A8C7E5E6_NAJNA
MFRGALAILPPPLGLRSVGHPCKLLLGAPLEVIPAFLHLLAGALPAGDAIDLAGNALPDPPAFGHRHPSALGAVKLAIVGSHFLDQDLVLLVRETRLAKTGDLLAVPRHLRPLDPFLRGEGALLPSGPSCPAPGSWVKMLGTARGSQLGAAGLAVTGGGVAAEAGPAAPGSKWKAPSGIAGQGPGSL